jgi:hypothetical protein
MHRTMMPATEWDRELIADLAAERTELRKSEVVGVRGLAATHETRLLGDIAKVLPVAIATRRSDREDALVVSGGLITIKTTARANLLATGDGGFGRIAAEWRAHRAAAPRSTAAQTHLPTASHQQRSVCS